MFRQFQTQDLDRLSTVTVVDSSGEVVLTGTVDQTPDDRLSQDRSSRSARRSP